MTRIAIPALCILGGCTAMPADAPETAAPQFTWEIGTHPVVGPYLAFVYGGSRGYAVTVSCEVGQNRLAFRDWETKGLAAGDHEISLSIGNRSAKAAARMEAWTPLNGEVLTFQLPPDAGVFATPAPGARVVLGAGSIKRDWGDGAAEAIATVAAACPPKRS